jgi:hypothetical protein
MENHDQFPEAERIADALRSETVESPPIADAVVLQLREHGVLRRTAKRGWMPWAAGAIAACIAFLLGLGVGTLRDARETVTQEPRMTLNEAATAYIAELENRAADSERDAAIIAAVFRASASHLLTSGSEAELAPAARRALRTVGAVPASSQKQVVWF